MGLATGKESRPMYDSSSAFVDFQVAESVAPPATERARNIPHLVFTQPDSLVRQDRTEDPSLLSSRANILVTFAGVILLLVQLIQLEDPVGIDIVEVLDGLVCSILTVDYLYDFAHSSDRKRFLKRRWWEFFACIPIIDTGQQAVLFIRLLRITRLIRIFKLRRDLSSYYSQGYDILKKHKVIDISSIVIFTVFSGSLGFFYVEQGINPNMKTYADSLWWALVTVTTIGYGDIFPVTNAGRLVASMMMLVGIGCVSILTGTIASNLLKNDKCPHCNGDL
jgi:voltage-gated potassium channel